MFNKLIKYEWRATGKSVLLTVGILALATGVFLAISLAPLLFISDMARIFAFGCAIVAPLVVVTILVISYYQSMCGSTGYFTMTLPVRGRVIFAAKFVYAHVATVIAMTVSFCELAVLVAAARVQRGAALATVLAGYRDVLRQMGAASLLVVLSVLVGIALQLVWLFFSISVGARARFHQFRGAGGAVLVGLGSYLFSQTALVASIFVFPVAAFSQPAPTGTLHWNIGFLNPRVLVAQVGTSSLDIVPLGWIFALVGLVGLLWWYAVRTIERAASLR